MTESEWVMHIIGPDEVHPMPDEITALRKANEANKFLASRERHEYDPFVIALAKDASAERV